ncbi:MAG TPA: GNAT family N-acetyltransferase [Mycobacteriales bacterium]|nr:GNAT family N-acetyltransferase [Mycobacteriales bacterium]
MFEVRLRRCLVDDAPAVERLRVAGWREAYRGIVSDAYLDAMPVDVERRRRLIAERADRLGETVAVDADEEVLGWIAVGPCRDGDRRLAPQGEVYACYVLPTHRRAGIGRQMLRHGLESLAEQGHPDVTLWVLEANLPARRFYEGFGFRPDGARQMLDLDTAVPEVRYHRPGSGPSRPSGQLREDR